MPDDVVEPNSDSLLGGTPETIGTQEGTAPVQTPQDTILGTDAVVATPRKHAWTSQLPKELQDNEALTSFTKIGDLGKAYSDLLGKMDSSIGLPGENATEEELRAFWGKIGTPDSSDGYELKLPDRVRAEKSFQDLQSNFKDSAHLAGLTKSQAEKLFELQVDSSMKGLEKQLQDNARAREGAEKALQDEWGDDYKPNLQMALRAVNKFMTPELVKVLDKNGLSNNPAMVKAFHAIYKEFGDDTFISSDGKRAYTGKATGQLSYGKDK